eukprot:TRINITY_DN5655_c0_g5_i1.p2 TRINITY_DN5655_c0_g5~~TRINITY_DN5655_c0_g5_i1.p2  ORF type:complete len:130 (-),score=6.23 TRINITY_DN5655_c0_g5_i1:304-693(-)
MKIGFIASTIYLVYLIRFAKPYSNEFSDITLQTYEKEKDDFGHFKYLLPLAAVLTLLIHTSWQPFEIIWSFSQWLEAFTIMPQFHLFRKMGEWKISPQIMSELSDNINFLIFSIGCICTLPMMSLSGLQ